MSALIGALTLALALAAPGGGSAKAAMMAADDNDKKAPLEITSDSMVTDSKNNLITFKGKVVAVKGGFRLEADEMTVWTTKEQNDFTRINATGAVKITKGAKIATGKQAEYLAQERKVTLTGEPALTDGPNQATGEEVVYFFDSEDMLITGGQQRRSTLVIFPKPDAPAAKNNRK